MRPLLTLYLQRDVVPLDSGLAEAQARLERWDTKAHRGLIVIRKLMQAECSGRLGRFDHRCRATAWRGIQLRGDVA